MIGSGTPLETLEAIDRLWFFVFCFFVYVYLRNRFIALAEGRGESTSLKRTNLKRIEEMMRLCARKGMQCIGGSVSPGRG